MNHGRKKGKKARKQEAENEEGRRGIKEVNDIYTNRKSARQ